MATGRKALKDSPKRGVGVTIDYNELHKEIARLKKLLLKVKAKLKSKGMSVHRVNFLLLLLKAITDATMCQNTMLESF